MTRGPARPSLRRALALPYVRSVASELDALAASQAMDADAIVRERARRLASLVRHALAHVPYYRGLGLDAREVAEEGFEPERLRAFPLLDKATLRDRFEDLKSDDLEGRDWSVNSSGGSTGEPTRFVQDAAYGRWRRATKILFDRWTGYEPGMPKVVLWGSERDLFRGRDSLRTRAVRALRNEHFLNAFRMGPEAMRAYADVLARVRPVQVRGYASSLHELASFALREGRALTSPRAVLSSAGTLHPSMRRTIEEAFGAPVFDRYGSREVGDLACEAEPGAGLAVSPLTHHVELLRPDGTPAAAGEVGEVVVTSLTNHAMPLVRYRIGDMAVWADDGATPAGIAWPRLAKVVGRTTDVFRKADGGVVIPEYLIHLIGVVLDRGDIARYQVVQEAYDRVRVAIVPRGGGGGPTPADREDLARKVRHVMGEACRVDVEVVADIPVPPSGKFRTTISKVPPP